MALTAGEMLLPCGGRSDKGSRVNGVATVLQARVPPQPGIVMKILLSRRAVVVYH